LFSYHRQRTMPRFAPTPPAAILEDIEAQFTLDDEQLLAIVRQFLDDFAAGLGDYGHSMAMM
jgi:hypothetical protein